MTTLRRVLVAAWIGNALRVLAPPDTAVETFAGCLIVLGLAALYVYFDRWLFND